MPETMIAATQSMNKSPVKDNEQARLIHARLMSSSHGGRNDDAIACMLSSWCVGQGAMPVRLGLDKDEFDVMMTDTFPGVELPFPSSDCGEGNDRLDEQDDLYQLLLANMSADQDDANWMAKIVIAGCMGADHLWQDLGLWSRDDLTRLMEINFPDLAKRNDKNMKWKKFLYKQLCIQEGVYTCRAPSCEVCADYKECFAPE